MANETIGQIVCGWCGVQADVRKAQTGRKKLYVMCANCGQQWLNTPAGQDIILERAIMYGAGGAPERSTPPIAKKAAAINPITQSDETPPPTQPKKSGFFDVDW